MSIARHRLVFDSFLYYFSFILLFFSLISFPLHLHEAEADARMHHTSGGAQDIVEYQQGHGDIVHGEDLERGWQKKSRGK